MTEQSSKAPGTYSLGRQDSFTRVLAGRPAPFDDGFFVPRLQPGMRLLDVGCGPGPITLSLAELVAPAEVVGIDVDPAMIERARSLADERGMMNVRFEVGDMHALAFPDAAFDVVFSQLTVGYTTRQIDVFREIHRVLAPEGIAGIVDADRSFQLHVPESDASRRRSEIEERAWRFNGGDPSYARNLRGLMLQAGFSRVEQIVFVPRPRTTDAVDPQDVTRKEALFRGLARTAVEQGWIDQETVEALAADLQEWAKRPDAFYCSSLCVAVAHV